MIIQRKVWVIVISNKRDGVVERIIIGEGWDNWSGKSGDVGLEN
jgi:hypothetical protein